MRKHCLTQIQSVQKLQHCIQAIFGTNYRFEAKIKKTTGFEVKG
jgi:hypothetical protein